MDVRAVHKYRQEGTHDPPDGAPPATPGHVGEEGNNNGGKDRPGEQSQPDGVQPEPWQEDKPDSVDDSVVLIEDPEPPKSLHKAETKPGDNATRAKIDHLLREIKRFTTERFTQRVPIRGYQSEGYLT